jgi:hypothetical protein
MRDTAGRVPSAGRAQKNALPARMALQVIAAPMAANRAWALLYLQPKPRRFQFSTHMHVIVPLSLRKQHQPRSLPQRPSAL